MYSNIYNKRRLKLYEAAKSLEQLMNEWKDEFRMETKDLVVTVIAEDMIEKFKKAIARAEGRE